MIKHLDKNIIYFIIFCFILSYFFQIGTTRGISMMPTMDNHCVVLLAPNYYNWFDYKEDDIIMFKGSGKYMCKRIKQVQRNRLWVEGDNKMFSYDSREFGWIEKGQVRSKIICKLYGF